VRSSVSAAPTAPSAAGVRIETIADAAGFRALRDEWTRLLERSASDCIFLTWEWLHTWWEHFGTSRGLALIAVRQGDELIGLAPLWIKRVRLGRLVPFRMFEFLGTGSVGSDYLDVIVRSGSEDEALAALALHLAREGRTLRLAQLDPRGAAAVALAGRLERHGWRGSKGRADVCPFIDLAGLTWDSYLATLSASHRYNVKRRLKAVTGRFDVRFEVAESDEQRRQALATLIDLHTRRWNLRGGSTALYSARLVAFHEDISRIALERGWLRLFVLRLDGRPVGALYGFRYRQSFCFYQTGFDPGYARYGVGQLTVGLTIKHALEEGAAEYDLLHGDERYKFDWARQVRALERIELYPPSARGWLGRRMAALDRMARKGARGVLPRVVADWLRRRADDGSE